MSTSSNGSQNRAGQKRSAVSHTVARVARKPFAAVYYVLHPFLKPVLRATVGRHERLWRSLQSARDSVLMESDLPTGLDAPLHRRLYTATFSVVGPPVRFVLKNTAGRNRAVWSGLQHAHIRLARGAPPQLWTPDAGTLARTNIRSRPFGVNLAGYLTSEKGTGEAARSAAAMLTATHVPLALNNIIDVSSVNRESPPGRLSSDNPYAFNLIWINADQATNFAFHKGRAYFEGRYNIGAWAWELLRFPNAWLNRFDYFHEIWVPSEFVVQALSRVSPVPVIRMHHPVERAPVAPTGIRSRFGLRETDYVFLFMFDYHSVLERKNPLGLIAAFKRAFRPDEPVTLLIKSSHSDGRTLRTLHDAAQGARIIITDRVLARRQVGDLYHLCDCYVSLHRSEGFGLTPAEAMAIGKPVIATGYGGNTDFMTDDNSFLVRYKLIELERDHAPYEKGSIWADPDLDHAAELMRAVYVDRPRAEAIGRRAAIDIQQLLGPDTIGDRMRDRLAAIADEIGVAMPVVEAKQAASVRRREAI